MQWIPLTFSQLSTRQLYDILRLRSEVFVVEQECAYQDLDGHDMHANTLHLLGYRDDKLTAYARILDEGVTYPEVAIGRVVTAHTERGNGAGHELIAQALLEIKEKWPNQSVMMGAQSHLVDFYGKHGFKVSSEEYMEDGIPHIDMTRKPA
ncbi:GNAT family N-acetyltransferase [Veronia nyctiphanis]|uniref:Protein ElaA n=1 Tax=Veronia nyctiphanis TaxID=1278244 RepID=A0A4Q0YQQ3_9GAMM|nr:GNAT family N-acetyltransferase [Veronia nyctiphanis]RXJ73386.1 GNAT family N-acetyltransferase [Veronia nyctiphanis]